MEEIGKDFAKELLATLKSTKEFVIEQAPDVVQQLIAYNIAEASLYLALGAAFMVSGFIFYIKGAKAHSKSANADDFMPQYLTAGTLGFVGGCMAVGTSLDLAKLILAPKIFLIEYLTRLVA